MFISNSNLPEIEKCDLWKKISKNRDPYLSGTVVVNGQTYRMTVFENQFKHENLKRPDYKFDKSKEK